MIVKIKPFLKLAVCAVLVFTLMLTADGCKDKSSTESDTSSDNSSEELVSFCFIHENLEGNETANTVYTSKETVGDALVELGIIEGEESEYGLYVKTVYGITLDYEKDGKYWAYYIDGQYSTEAIDKTEIKEGSVYTLKPQS